MLIILACKGKSHWARINKDHNFLAHGTIFPISNSFIPIFNWTQLYLAWKTCHSYAKTDKNQNSCKRLKKLLCKGNTHWGRINKGHNFLAYGAIFQISNSFTPIFNWTQLYLAWKTCHSYAKTDKNQNSCKRLKKLLCKGNTHWGRINKGHNFLAYGAIFQISNSFTPIFNWTQLYLAWKTCHCYV